MSGWDTAAPVAVVEERSRLARELHDGVAQNIVAMLYRVDSVAGLIEAGPARESVAALRDDLARLAREVRTSIEELRSEPVLAGGLPRALSSYVGELRPQGDLRVHLHLDAGTVPLPALVEREVLKIAQEAITNVRRHAHAINLWVRLTADSHRLSLVVEDDGIGTVGQRLGHFGLQGMRERAERIGAELAIGVRQDGGTVVTLSSRVTDIPTREGDGHDRQDLARR